MLERTQTSDIVLKVHLKFGDYIQSKTVNKATFSKAAVSDNASTRDAFTNLFWFISSSLCRSWWLREFLTGLINFFGLMSWSQSPSRKSGSAMTLLPGDSDRPVSRKSERRHKATGHQYEMEQLNTGGNGNGLFTVLAQSNNITAVLDNTIIRFP